MGQIIIIPARGGSKRIPRKNIQHFLGKPMIAYAIDTAKATGYRTVVSTEDEEIAHVSRVWGAEVLDRPAHLADDHTTTAEVMQHAVQALTLGTADEVCCLYPCTPLLTTEQLLKGLIALSESGARYTFPIQLYAPPVQRMLRLWKGAEVESVWSNFDNVHSNVLEPRYHDAGQWYWGTYDAWHYAEPIYRRHSVGLPIGRNEAVDIDTPEDWALAEALYLARITQ